MNLLFHVLNALLVFFVLTKATSCVGRSFAVAALFAVHPMNVEPVAWVAELKTLLSAFFFLLALLAYQQYARKPREPHRWLVVLLFAMALMGKPQAIMLPFVLLLWDYWPLHRKFPEEQNSSSATSAALRLDRRLSGLIWEKLPLFALSVADAALTLQGMSVGQKSWPAYGLPLRIGAAMVAYATYVVKMFWPLNLAPDYVYPGNSLPAWQAAAAFGFLMVVSVAVVAKRRRPYLLVGWLWFIVTLLPMIGIVQGPAFTADRYAYISYIGLFMMISWGVFDLLAKAAASTHAARPAEPEGATELWQTDTPHRHPRTYIFAVSVCIVAVLSLMAIAYRQLGYWQDDASLWSHTLQVTPDEWGAEVALGLALKLKGNAAEAHRHFARALTLYGDDALANLEVGFWDHQHGDLRAAIEHYKKALSAPNTDAEITIFAARNLGHIYRALGDDADAEAYFAKAADEVRRQEQQ